jgi:hypothetical protein
MVAFAPFCNVTVFTPPPGSTSPTGFRTLSPTASLQDVIGAFNNNFSPQRQQTEFDRMLQDDLNKPSSSSRIRSAARKETGQLRFTQASIVRQKIKVENPQDKEQWVIDDRVKALVMKDRRTGATWVWVDKNAGKGVQAGSEETG